MQLIRIAVTTAVEATARVLSFAGSALGTVGRLIQTPRPESVPARPDESSSVDLGVVPEISRPGDDDSTDSVLERVAKSKAAARRGRVVAAPPTPLLDTEPHVRRAETHIAELAENTATDVIGEIEHLSTDELRQLIEYESAHRNRKTVLAAIEKALAPVPSGAPSTNGRG